MSWKAAYLMVSSDHHAFRKASTARFKRRAPDNPQSQITPLQFLIFGFPLSVLRHQGN
jgi:hypothetical protein